MSEIKPTVGRLVYFRRGGKETVPLAALVCAVTNDTHLNLAVFEQGGESSGHQRVPYFDVTSKDEAPIEFWDWMPFQKGQAGKTDELAKQLQDAKPADPAPKSNTPAGMASTYTTGADRGAPDSAQVEGQTATGDLGTDGGDHVD